MISFCQTPWNRVGKLAHLPPCLYELKVVFTFFNGENQKSLWDMKQEIQFVSLCIGTLPYSLIYGLTGSGTLRAEMSDRPLGL